jgi:YesN/AraC family two-component response regulator
MDWNMISAIEAVNGGAPCVGFLVSLSVANHFGLAPNHVSRLFRREGQTRFSDYLNLVRMNRAKFMLHNYRLTVKEVAANCGYSDVAYFCRIFKKMNNETPRQYHAMDSGGPR